MNSILYVGMDVHTSNYTLCTYTIEGDREFALTQVKPDHLNIVRYIKRLKEHHGQGTRIVCGYEAGGLGYSLYRALEACDVECVILAPSTMPKAPNEGQDVYHYHLHVVYVPVVEKQILWSKRCKDPSLVGTVKDTVMQVSMSKKWASVPAIDPRTGEPMRTAAGKPVLKKSYSQLQDDFHEHMLHAGYTDLERGERGSSEEHLTVTQFKVAQEETRLAMFQQSTALALAESEHASEEWEKAVEKLHEAEQKARQEESRIHDLAPKLKNIEKLAAEFSADPDKLLPESGALESAKSYREKKAKPLLARIVKVLRGIYRAYLDLLDKHKRLEKSYEFECNANKSLTDKIETLTAERAEMAEKAAGYETLCTELGREYVEEHIRRAKDRKAAHRTQSARKPYMDSIAI